MIPEIDALAAELVAMLQAQGRSFATAESCTGGAISQAVTSVAGCSSVMRGAVVAYHNDVKEKVLGVSGEVLATYGAVSEETVVQMVDGVSALMGADCAVATSGIAGPGGGTPEKPVGTVWIAVAGPNGTQAQEFHFSATRERNIAKASLQALQWLVESIQMDMKKGG